MRRLGTAVLLAIGLLAIGLLTLGASLLAQAPSLYKRLGGYDALAAVTDEFIGRLASDSSLGRFFVGHSKESQMSIRQLVVDQLCAATGGPCVYIGRSRKAAHAGLAISGADWDRAVADVLRMPLRGRRQERLGRRDEATTAYAYVVDAWARADSVLQPYVAEARAGLGRLRAEPKP